MPELALYYPEWTTNDPVFIAASFLFWDRLACIVPFAAFHDLPDWCRPENLKLHEKQIFSAYRFAPETVALLRERRWARQFPRPQQSEDPTHFYWRLAKEEQGLYARGSKTFSKRFWKRSQRDWRDHKYCC